MPGLLAFLALVVARNLGFWRYWLSDPVAFDARSAAALFCDVLLPAAAVAVLVVSMTRLGRRLGFLALASEPETPLAFALGLTTLGTAFMLWAWAGGLSQVGLVGAALLVLVPFLLKGRPPTKRADTRSSLTLSQQLLAAGLAWAAFDVLVRASAPPTEWDSLAYHLTLPKLYLEASGLVEVPWLMHGHWPHLPQLLSALLLGFGLETGAAWLQAACAGALVWAVWRAGREHGDASVGWLAAGILAAQTPFLRVAGAAHADAAFALLSFASAVCLWRFVESGRTGALLAAGGLAGGAAACKLHGLIPLAFWTGWLAWRIAPTAAVRYAACGAAIVAPWLLRCWLETGNPIWPFLSGWLGGRFGAASIGPTAVAQSRWPWPPSAELLLRHDPLLLLAPLALAWALTRRDALPPALRFWLLPIPVYLLVVGRQRDFWRYMLPFFPALALALAWRLRRLATRERVGVVAAVLLAATSIMALPFRTQNDALFAVFALRVRSAPDADPRSLYLERTLEHYGPFRAIGRELAGRPARILLFREIRGYYLEADYVWGDPYNQGLIDYDALPDAAGLARRLDELGITHVLVNEQLERYARDSGYYSARTLALMDEELAAARLVERMGAIALYERRAATR